MVTMEVEIRMTTGPSVDIVTIIPTISSNKVQPADFGPTCQASRTTDAEEADLISDGNSRSKMSVTMDGNLTFIKQSDLIVNVVVINIIIIVIV